MFQRDIVFNPKKADSYLYLAKIFKIEENIIKEEKNLNTTLLLDPKNEEALYMLIDIKLKRSNFTEVKELQKRFGWCRKCEKNEMDLESDRENQSEMNLESDRELAVSSNDSCVE